MHTLRMETREGLKQYTHAFGRQLKQEHETQKIHNQIKCQPKRDEGSKKRHKKEDGERPRACSSNGKCTLCNLKGHTLGE